MGNPLFTAMMQPQTYQQRPESDIFTMMQKFNQFRQSFTGDPKQKVQELLQSGRMTQEQFQNLSNMANQMFGMFR